MEAQMQVLDANGIAGECEKMLGRRVREIPHAVKGLLAKGARAEMYVVLVSDAPIIRLAWPPPDPIVAAIPISCAKRFVRDLDAHRDLAATLQPGMVWVVVERATESFCGQYAVDVTSPH